MGVRVHQGRHQNTWAMVDDPALTRVGPGPADFHDAISLNDDAAVFNPGPRLGHDPAGPVNNGVHFRLFSTG